MEQYKLGNFLIRQEVTHQCFVYLTLSNTALYFPRNAFNIFWVAIALHHNAPKIDDKTLEILTTISAIRADFSRQDITKKSEQTTQEDFKWVSISTHTMGEINQILLLFHYRKFGPRAMEKPMRLFTIVGIYDLAQPMIVDPRIIFDSKYEMATTANFLKRMDAPKKIEATVESP